MSTPDISFQQNVAAILRNREGKILICERIHFKNAWQFPQGGVDEGETLEQALTRELSEEIGLRPEDFSIVEKRGGYRYMFPKGPRKGHDGKEQTYFLCEFTGKDSSITVETEHPEFRDWKWVLPSEFQARWLPPMKLDVYGAVFRDFFGIHL